MKVSRSHTVAAPPYLAGFRLELPLAVGIALGLRFIDEG
jgi:hypothetical protein